MDGHGYEILKEKVSIAKGKLWAVGGPSIDEIVECKKVEKLEAMQVELLRILTNTLERLDNLESSLEIQVEKEREIYYAVMRDSEAGTKDARESSSFTDLAVKAARTDRLFLSSAVRSHQKLYEVLTYKLDLCQKYLAKAQKLEK